MISRPSEFWTLSGPRRFTDEVCGEIYSTNLVVVEDRLEPQSTADALCNRLRLDRIYNILDPAIWEDTLLSTIAKAVGCPDRKLGAILADNLYTGHVLILVAETVTDAKLGELRNFAIARSTIKQRDEPALLIVVIARDVAMERIPATWQVKSMLDVVGPLDSIAFASAIVDGPSWLLKRLKSAVAVEVGCWDLNLVATIASASPERAVRPDAWDQVWSEAYAILPGKPTWQNGQVCRWGDELVPHAAWLAQKDQPRLLKRIWTGQVSALLPWIEQYRLKLVEGYPTHLLRSVDGSIGRTSVEQLDWGPIWHALRYAKVPNSVKKLADVLRRVRNELAHGRPVQWNQISDALSVTARFDRDSGLATPSTKR